MKLAHGFEAAPLGAFAIGVTVGVMPDGDVEGHGLFIWLGRRVFYIVVLV